jgi:hypothetical protein
MPTVVATVGASTANSFVTVAEGDTYCDARLNASSWTDAADDDKARAVIEATRWLSARLWQGERASSTQALSWPRFWAPNPDFSFGANLYFDSTIVPQRVKDATCELALQFLKAGTSDAAAIDPNAQIIEQTVGPITTRYADPYARVSGLAKYPSVTRLIAPLMNGDQNSAEVIRG